jgi:hypothetical protein
MLSGSGVRCNRSSVKRPSRVVIIRLANSVQLTLANFVTISKVQHHLFWLVHRSRTHSCKFLGWKIVAA